MKWKTVDFWHLKQAACKYWYFFFKKETNKERKSLNRIQHKQKSIIIITIIIVKAEREKNEINRILKAANEKWNPSQQRI